LATVCPGATWTDGRTFCITQAFFPDRARYVGEVRGETHKDGPIDADGISYVPELAVGRFPVSDVASLQALVAKTLAWTPSAPSALLVHADGWVDERARLAAAGTALAVGGTFVVTTLVAVAAVSTSEGWVLGLAAAAGALALAAGAAFKAAMILRGAYNQGFAIPRMPVRGTRA